MQKESQIRNHTLQEQINKLRFIDDIIKLNTDFLLGFILKDAKDLKPQLINDLSSVVQLLIDIKDCEVINKNTFFEFILVFSLVFQNLHKHSITSLMKFYQQSIDEVTNDPDYFKKKFFVQVQERNQSKIINQINQNKQKIQEKISRIQILKSKLDQLRNHSKLSQMRVASLVRSKSELAECPICLVQINHENISILACGHIFHKQCFEQSMKDPILNKRFPLKCPSEQCTKNIETQDIEEYLPKDLVDKYLEFTLHNFVDKNSKNMTWCPSPGCTNACEFDQGITNFDCTKCGKHYCLSCKTESHPDITCEQNRQMNNLSQEDKQFLKFVKGAKYKQCPKCKFWVSKNKGCCHMTCRCTYEFCYVCGSQYGTCNCSSEYEHYYGSPDESEVSEGEYRGSEEGEYEGSEEGEYEGDRQA